MFSYFTQRAKYRKYKHDVDRSINELFYGFKSEILTSARTMVNVDKGVRALFDDQVPPKECAIVITSELIGRVIDCLPQNMKGVCIAAMEANDKSNQFNRAINFMTNTAELYTKDEYLLNVLTTEIVGKLRGMSRSEIDAMRRTQGINKIFRGG